MHLIEVVDSLLLASEAWSPKTTPPPLLNTTLPHIQCVNYTRPGVYHIVELEELLGESKIFITYISVYLFSSLTSYGSV